MSQTECVIQCFSDTLHNSQAQIPCGARSHRGGTTYKQYTIADHILRLVVTLRDTFGVMNVAFHGTIIDLSELHFRIGGSGNTFPEEFCDSLPGRETMNTSFAVLSTHQKVRLE